MINLNTPNEVMLEELATDYEKARFWAEKTIKKSQNKPMLRRMFTDHRRTGKTQYSDIILYTSTNGNKWCMYWTTDLSSGRLGVRPRGFAYYETEGSIGAFLPMSDESGGIKKCVILPSHFFLRLKQRLGIEHINKETIQRLTEPLESLVLDYKGNSDKRKHEIEVSISGSVWRGVFRDGDVRVVDVRTFLTERSLSRKEQAKAQNLAEAQMGAAAHSRRSVKERMDKGEAHLVFEELFRNEDEYHISGSLPYSYAVFSTLSEIIIRSLGMDFSREKFRSMCVKVDKQYSSSGFLSLLWELSYNSLEDEEEAKRLLELTYMMSKNFGYKGTAEGFFECFNSAMITMYNECLPRIKPYLPFEKRILGD